MKILLSYPNESDKGEGVHFERVLRRLGHDVRVLNVAVSGKNYGAPGWVVRGYPPEVTMEDLLREQGGGDLFLYIEPFALIPQGMESSPIPTACVISDVHRNLKPRIELARFFDRVFLYQRNYLSSFREHGEGAVFWLPYACDTEVFRDLGTPRDLDVAFIGQRHGPGESRNALLSRISSRWKVSEDRYYLQKEIPEVYSRSKIVLNLPVARDLNFRFFEALSCGALLLTERERNGQEELFQEGVHYVAYGNEQELLEKVEFYLEHDAERERIAKAGWEEVRKKHRLDQRVEFLIEKTVSGPAKCAPIRTLPPRDRIRLYARLYERGRQIETLLRMGLNRESGFVERCLWNFSAFRIFLRRWILGS